MMSDRRHIPQEEAAVVWTRENERRAKYDSTRALTQQYKGKEEDHDLQRLMYNFRMDMRAKYEV